MERALVIVGLALGVAELVFLAWFVASARVVDDLQPKPRPGAISL